MKRTFAIALMLTGLVAAVVLVANAATKEVTVGYLQAAASSLTDQTEVTVTAVYPGVASLRDCHGLYLRNDGYSRFTIKDPQSKAVFDSMYVLQTTKAFPVLVKANGQRRMTFRGYKERGEDHDDAIFVTSVEDLGPAGPPAGPAPGTVTGSVTETATSDVGVLPAPTIPPRAYRVTITDNATSNRTVIINIETNRPYTVNGTTVVVEQEP